MCDKLFDIDAISTSCRSSRSRMRRRIRQDRHDQAAPRREFHDGERSTPSGEVHARSAHEHGDLEARKAELSQIDKVEVADR